MESGIGNGHATRRLGPFPPRGYDAGLRGVKTRSNSYLHESGDEDIGKSGGRGKYGQVDGDLPSSILRNLRFQTLGVSSGLFDAEPKGSIPDQPVERSVRTPGEQSKEQIVQIGGAGSSLPTPLLVTKFSGLGSSGCFYSFQKLGPSGDLPAAGERRSGGPFDCY